MAKTAKTPNTWPYGADGSSVTVDIDDLGALTVSGEGKMKDYDNTSNKAPWLDCRSVPIISVVIKEGVTHIGNWSFAGGDDLVSVIIPDGVTSIGEYAFANCPNLITVTMLANVEPKLGKEAFSGCVNLKLIAAPYINGT